MPSYRTVQGDTWDSIAFKVYGDEMKMDRLIGANTEYLEMVIFPANIMLNVPELTTSTNISFPVWR